MIALCLGSGASAESVGPSPTAVAFDHFLKSSTPVCEKQASTRCVDLGWRFADTNGDGYLSLAELEALNDTARSWFAWKGDGLPVQERAPIALGLAMVESRGVANLMRGYDTNGDGRLSRAELLVDVHLDKRPLGEVLRDPNGLDRKATARRLGIMGPLFAQLFR